MAKVQIDYLDQNGKPIKQDEVITSGDSVFLLDDIGNHMNLDDEMSNVPKGTKKIVITVPCDM